MKVFEVVEKANSLQQQSNDEYFVIVVSDLEIIDNHFKPASYAVVAVHNLETLNPDLPQNNIVYSSLKGAFR